MPCECCELGVRKAAWLVSDRILQACVAYPATEESDTIKIGIQTTKLSVSNVFVCQGLNDMNYIGCFFSQFVLGSNLKTCEDAQIVTL